jgi:hypothetical protein
MKNFKNYLTESAKDHVYVIKFAMEPTNEQIDIIESWLKRFELKTSTKVTVIENDNKDFIDVPNRKVFAFEVTLGTPVSQYILLQDLKTAANISEKYMIVRSALEPIEQYAEIDTWNRMQDAVAKDKGLIPAARLSTDRVYPAAEAPRIASPFGDEYNKKFLSYLASVASSRTDNIVTPSSPLFDWINEDISPGEPHQDTADFNAHIKGPKPVSKGKDTPPVEKGMTVSHGALSDNTIPHVKYFQNTKTGKKQQVANPVRKV